MPFASRLETQQLLIANSLTLAQATSPEIAPPSSTTSNLSALPTLSPASQGPEVKQLQTTLKALGYYNGTVDGVYGNMAEVKGLDAGDKIITVGYQGLNDGDYIKI